MNYPPQQSFPQNPPPFAQPMPGAPYPPPYMSPNPPQQPPRKPRRRLMIVLGSVVGGLLLCVVSLVLIISLAPATSQTPSATKQSTQATTAQPTTKPTRSSRPAITHGTPRLGGPLSDFYGKYGTPNNQGAGNSETWIADQQQQIIVNARPDANGKVDYVSVTGSSSWSRSQTEAYCDQFLPTDASEFNRVSDSIQTLIDYHSSIGEVVMTVVDQGSCVLNLSQS